MQMLSQWNKPKGVNKLVLDHATAMSVIMVENFQKILIIYILIIFDEHYLTICNGYYCPYSDPVPYLPVCKMGNENGP